MKFSSGLDGLAFYPSLDTSTDPKKFERDVAENIHKLMNGRDYPDQSYDKIIYGFDQASNLLHEPRMLLISRMYGLARWQHPDWSAERMAHELCYEACFENKFNVNQIGEQFGMVTFEVSINLTGKWNDMVEPYFNPTDGE